MDLDRARIQTLGTCSSVSDANSMSTCFASGKCFNGIAWHSMFRQGGSNGLMPMPGERVRLLRMPKWNANQMGLFEDLWRCLKGTSKFEFDQQANDRVDNSQTASLPCVFKEPKVFGSRRCLGCPESRFALRWRHHRSRIIDSMTGSMGAMEKHNSYPWWLKKHIIWSKHGWRFNERLSLLDLLAWLPNLTCLAFNSAMSAAFAKLQSWVLAHSQHAKVPVTLWQWF